MKSKSFFIFFLTIFFCIASYANTQHTSAARLADLLSHFTQFEARFQQITMNAQQQILQKSNGYVMLKRPGQFRWETKKPMHQVIITNGKKLWVYDFDLKQATEQSVEHDQMNPAKFLSGNVHDMLEQFNVVMIPHHGILVFQLTPKKLNQSFRTIGIAFRYEKLISMQIQENSEQSTRFDFFDSKLNPHLPDSLFEFTAPAGVDVLR